MRWTLQSNVPPCARLPRFILPPDAVWLLADDNTPLACVTRETSSPRYYAVIHSDAEPPLDWQVLDASLSDSQLAAMLATEAHVKPRQLSMFEEQ